MELQISEPWEFETEVGTGYLAGKIVAAVQEADHDSVKLVVALTAPVTFEEATFDGLLARPRYRPGTETNARAPAIFNLLPIRLDGRRRLDIPFLIGSMGLRH